MRWPALCVTCLTRCADPDSLVLGRVVDEFGVDHVVGLAGLDRRCGLAGGDPTQQAAQLAEVRGDAVALAVELGDLALGGGQRGRSLGLGFVDRGLGVRLGLGDELLGVALGAGDQGLGLLVGLAANLLGTLVRGRGPGFGVGRTCLGVVDELLGLGDRSLVALVDLALELFTLGDELQLVLGVLLLRLDLGFVQDGLGLCAHGLGLALGGGALLLDFALGRGPQLGDLALGDGSQPADLSLGLRPALAGLVIDRRTNLGGLALGGFDQVRRFAVGRGTNLFGLDPRFVDELV